MMEKPDCYRCIYREELPHSAHSKCNHPAFKELVNSPMGEIIGLMGKRMGTMQAKVSTLKVEGDERGIKKGWFNHPFNFDPVWLVSCEGFKEKEE